MEEYEYNGSIITETFDGNYMVDDVEFPTLDEAIDWLDDQVDIPETPEHKLHTYVIFYIDNATDMAFEVSIQAYNFKEAEKILRRDYDVFAVTDWYVIE